MRKEQEIPKGLNRLSDWRTLGISISKTNGSDHYRGEVESIELTASDGNLEGFCLGSIHKYASRYKETQNKKDLIKIVDYAQILLGYKFKEEILDVDSN